MMGDLRVARWESGKTVFVSLTKPSFALKGFAEFGRPGAPRRGESHLQLAHLVVTRRRGVPRHDLENDQVL